MVFAVRDFIKVEIITEQCHVQGQDGFIVIDHPLHLYQGKVIDIPDICLDGHVISRSSGERF